MTPLHQVLLEAARISAEADFSAQREAFLRDGTNEPVLNASFLRRLILGIRPTELPEDFDPSQTFRWSFRGLTIDGDLDLTDGRGRGGTALPALLFSECHFRHRFCADNAEIGSLIIRNCSFAHLTSANASTCQLSVRNLRCNDELILDDIHALNEDDLFSVDARALRAGASVTFRNSTFRAAVNQVTDLAEPIYALNLRNADIKGDLLLEPRMKLFGGVHAVGAKIGGSVFAAGLYTTDGDDDEFRLESSSSPRLSRGALIFDNATIGGNVALYTLVNDEPFQAIGSVNLETVTIQGNFVLVGAKISATSNDRQPLSLFAGKIRGCLYAQTTSLLKEPVENQIAGTINLCDLEVGADLLLSANFSSLVAPSLRVGGDVEVFNLRRTVLPDREAPKVNLLVQLTGAAIQGNFSLGNAVDRASLTATDIAARTKVLGLDLNALTVGHAIHISGLYSNLWGKNLSVSNDMVLQIELLSQLALVDAKIGGSLDLSRFHFTNRGRGSALNIPTLYLTNSEIRGSLKVGDSSSEDSKILLRSARIARPLCYPTLSVIEVEAFRDEVAKEKNQTEWAAFLAGANGIASSLDGNSAIFHLANSAGLRLTRTDLELADYLRLFCAYVWGDDGSFRILEQAEDLKSNLLTGAMPQLGPLVLSRPDRHAKENIIATTTAVIAYANTLFRADLALPKNGVVAMLHDAPLGEIDPAQATVYATPLRRGPHANDPEYHPSAWEELNEAQLTARVPRWKESFRQTASFANAFIDLQNASCTTLEDSDGTAWGNQVQLRLENFSFRQVVASQVDRSADTGLLWAVGERSARFAWNWQQRFVLAVGPMKAAIRRLANLPIQTPPELGQILAGGAPLWFSNLAASRQRRTGVRDRLRWLEQRFVVTHIPTAHPGLPILVRDSFLPQPYTQLAKVFRDQGAEDAAKKVEEQRIRTEHWLRAKESFTGKLFLPISGLFRIGFRYGLSPGRAASTFALLILLGWAAVHFTNSGPHPLLIQNTQTANTVAALSADGPSPAIPIVAAGQLLTDPPCGRTISEFLYAVDVFIPLLDLRQEERCDIRALNSSDRSPSRAFSVHVGGLPSKLFAWLHASVVYPPLWQWLKALYAVLGWIVTSLTILTFSGTLRKWDES